MNVQKVKLGNLSRINDIISSMTNIIEKYFKEISNAIDLETLSDLVHDLAERYRQSYSDLMHRSSILNEFYLRNQRQIGMTTLLMNSSSYEKLNELEIELYTIIAPTLQNRAGSYDLNSSLLQRKRKMQISLKDKLEEIKSLIEDTEAQSKGHKDRTKQGTAYPIEAQILTVNSLGSSLQEIRAD